MKNNTPANPELKATIDELIKNINAQTNEVKEIVKEKKWDKEHPLHKQLLDVSKHLKFLMRYKKNIYDDEVLGVLLQMETAYKAILIQK